jgi:response regulator RpfG family c-di-GMP phosphodiesterase
MTMASQKLPRVLCVDDEARVLEGLVLHLRKDYEVLTASSGEQALQKLRETGGVAVVVSDMRMPGMDGATLLQQVRQSFSAATRILLTGDAGRDAAVNAVNKGQIFRFLTKPCAPADLRAAIEAGVMQHRLVNAERAVLQETLLGCIEAMIDVLAITNPVAFGRAVRVKRLAVELAERLEHTGFWQLSAAAMLSQIGYISLPVEMVEKLYYGERLTPEEKVLASAVPQVAGRLLEHIPRLEPVIQVLAALEATDEQVARLGDGTIGTAARILGLVLAYDQLITQGRTSTEAVQTLRPASARFSASLIETLAQHVGAPAVEGEIREMPLRQVTAGMTIMQDIRTSLGTLLVPKGFEVTHTFRERISNFGPDLLAERVKVLVGVQSHERR